MLATFPSLIALRLGLACAGDPAATADLRPDLVVVDIDTLRADRLDATRDGTPVMPELHALADRGVRFDQMVSQSGWTAPAVHSLLTGRLPGMPDQGPATPADGERTVAEILGLYGYHTAALWSEGPARGSQNTGRGCAWSSGITLRETDAAALDAQIDDWMAQGKAEPFFLLVHHFDAHVPGPRTTRADAHRFVTAEQAANCPMGDYQRTYDGLL